MNKINEYSRNFLYFKPEDKGFDNGREPSGFVSFDIRDGKGKLTAYIENLSESGNYEYKLYLISSTEAQSTPVFVAKLKLVKNKAQISSSFDASNVDDSGLRFDEFNIAAVIVEYNERNSNIICPLAAYKGAKTEWKSKLRDVLYQKKPEEISKPAIYEQKPGLKNELKKDEIAVGERNEKFQHVKILNQNQEYGQTDQVDKGNQANQAGNIVIHTIHKNKANQGNQANQVENIPVNELAEQAVSVQQAEKTEKAYEASAEDISKNTIYSNPNSNLNSISIKNPNNIPNNNPNNNPNNSPNNSPNNNPNNNTQNDELYCKNCADTQCIKNNSKKSKRNNDKFTYTFDKYLERCDPFNSGRKDYVWWKAGSTYYLNTILYWINVRTPIMLSPSVFNASCKYGHLIVGIYTDFNTNEKHLVFGIPGKFGTEMKPFGELGRWAQADLSKPEYDAFGYWLIYMDPYSARVIE